MIFVLVIVAAPPAHAAPWYYYYPGHPMRLVPSQNHCTGAWAIRGRDGMFFLTAGHCFDINGLVSGTSANFGVVRRDDHRRPGGMDALLVAPHQGVDALQIAVRPDGGNLGRVVGIVHNNELLPRRPIGKSGQTTGWTESTIVGTFTWSNGERVVCGDYHSLGGDSGGPVLIRDGVGRAWAAGMHVGRLPLEGGRSVGCFITIDDLLARFGASLPVFPSRNAVASYVRSSETALPADLPTLVGVAGIIPD